MADNTKQEIFERLRNIMKPIANQMITLNDEPENFELSSQKKDKKGRDIWFGAVQVKKNYVSYHLMPVYVYPELLNDVSDDLKKRMQGKSCFNFKKPDEKLFRELEDLTKRGAERFDKIDKPPY